MAVEEKDLEKGFPKSLSSLPVKDTRLAPRVPMPLLAVVTMEDGTPMPVYGLTEESHPELMATLKSCLVKAGIKVQPQLVMYGDGSGMHQDGGTDKGQFSNSTVTYQKDSPDGEPFCNIRIGDHFVAHGSLESIKQKIAYNIGREWRYKHHIESGLVPAGSYPAKYKDLIEADAIGAYFLGDKTGGLQMIADLEIIPTVNPHLVEQLAARKAALHSLHIPPDFKLPVPRDDTPAQATDTVLEDKGINLGGIVSVLAAALLPSPILNVIFGNWPAPSTPRNHSTEKQQRPSP